MRQSNRNIFQPVHVLFLLAIFSIDVATSFNFCSCPSANPASCMCDEQCYRYGDCCIDAANVKIAVPVYPNCSYISVDGSFYVNRTCSNPIYKTKCLKSVNYTTQSYRWKTKIPVTSPSSGITYGNMFCAKCQKVTDYVMWNAIFTCETYNKTINASSSWPSLPRSRFDNITSSWLVTDERNKTEKCTAAAALPDSLKTVVRRCYANMVKSCPYSTPFNEKCQSYQAVVFNNSGVPFNNLFCLLCNGQYFWKDTCIVAGTTTIKSTTTILAATTSSISSNSTTRVRKPRILRPWLGKMRWINSMSTTNSSSAGNFTISPTVIDRSTSSSAVATSPSPLAVRVSTKRKTYLHLNIRMHCVTALGSINITKIRAETIIYRTFNRTYVRNATLIEGDTIRLCRLKNWTVSGTGKDTVDDFFSSLSWYSVKLGAVVALLAIGSHLRAYFSPEYERTCRHKIAASYAFSLFIGNAGIAMGNYVGVGSYLWYLGFISSFFWISSMAFEVSLAAWSVTGNYAVTARKWNVADDDCSRRRFKVYSWISWLGAVLILAMVLIWHAADVSRWDFVIVYSYSQDSTFLLFFVLPLTVTASLNLAFYLCTAYVMCTEPKTVDKLSKLGIEYGLHGGILLTTNAMWATLALADYLFNDWLTLLYVLLDVLLAYFVYVGSPGINEFTIKTAALKGDNVYTLNAQVKDEK